MSYEPKTAKDMEKQAEELLQAMFKVKMVHINSVDGSIIISFDQAISSISHYLFDAYNNGYDDCIIETSKLKLRT